MSDRLYLSPLRPVRDNNPREAARASGQAASSFSVPSRDEGKVPVDLEHSILLAAGVDWETLRRAAVEARAAGVPVRDVLIASGALDAAHYCEMASRLLGLPVHRADGRAGARLINADPEDAWRVIKSGAPVLMPPETVAGLNVQAFPPRMLAQLGRELGDARKRLRLLTRRTLIEAVSRWHRRELLRGAVFGLLMRRPELSARSGIALWQTIAGAAGFGAAAGAFLFAPREVLLISAALFSAIFILSVTMRFAAAFTRWEWKAKAEPARIPDDELPVYSVLVPLFREVAILPHLAAGLRQLDYPAAKLDIKIVLEEIDRETIAAAYQAGFGGNVDFIIVPDSEPRTKPKALNYALNFAVGDFAVVYDAEDRPDPDQLRKAVAAFARAPAEVICLQARLDYYNPTENWLTRQFTIEYASLFRGLLPYFGKARLPLPLGGTSNHFRMEALRKLGAWDAFNVTEDADLGMRLFRAGYRAEMLDSTTAEEAVSKPSIWLRQRTRWLKGWIQTYGVHMRDPVALARDLGFRSFVAFQIYFAGIILSALCHPIFYTILLYDLFSGRFFTGLMQASDQTLYTLAAANFAGGYAASVWLGAVGLARSEHRNLGRDLLFIPFYWLLISAAAYRAVWQLARAPFHWEKTPHGHSRVARAARNGPS